MSTSLTADYLVVGAGAMGMAFADTLISETDRTIIIVDRFHQPGGHWTLAYPFVRLHQPSVGYGVNSKPLGANLIDTQGWNAGLYELASAGEVCAYFDQVMQQTLLPSGRVRYFPMSDYLGEGRIRSRVSGQETIIGPGFKTVDSTYQNVSVPAMRPPPYQVEARVSCVPPNALTERAPGIDHFTIIGAGKTGIDACLWLLRQGVDPDAMTWIMPRDSWLIDRAHAQPGPEFADVVTAALMGQIEAISTATSYEDLLVRLEACGRLLRIDPRIRPTMYRCATVSKAELAQLRRITDIVRKGRVQRIEAERIILDHGSIPTGAQTLHVDCSADGLERRPEVPVFQGRLITLQSVRACQQVFSAALIAHVEACYPDEAERNELCQPIAHPDSERDLFTALLADNRNERRWAGDAALQKWFDAARLDWVRHLGPQLPVDPTERAAALQQRRAAVEMASARLEALLAT